jgi:hypothetical protein
VLSELYKTGKVRQEALGVLAKTIICIKTGCLASGPEVSFAGSTIQLAETITLTPQTRPPQKETKQARQTTTQRRQPQPAPRQAPKQEAPRQPAEKPPQTPPSQEPPREATSWDALATLLANEAKIDKSKAESVLDAVANYLAVYPSVGVIRLIEDAARIAKADQRAVRAAIEILRSADVIELKEEGVVNLKKPLKRGEIPL